MTPPGGTPPWWQAAVFYQVYPRSFLDTDGDGVGDLAGQRRRLAYLAWLGVDVGRRHRAVAPPPVPAAAARPELGRAGSG